MYPCGCIHPLEILPLGGLMSNTWETSLLDIEIATKALIIQLEGFGINTEDKGIQMFIEHEAKVLGALYAQCRFLQAIIHKEHFN